MTDDRNTWSLIFFDGESSTQIIECSGDPEQGARDAVIAHDWLAEFTLVAAVRDAAEIRFADRARTGEMGLL